MSTPDDPHRDPAPSTEDVLPGRVVKDADDRVQPLYRAARLVKGAVLEADANLAKSHEVLAAAKDEAARIVAQAKQDADVELERAREAGFAEGAATFRALIESATSETDRLATSFSDEVTRVAFRIAREIIDAEFARAPEHVERFVEAAIRHVRSRFPKRMCVHLHPDDYAIVHERCAHLASALPNGVAFDCMRDETLTRGSVVLETEMGHYDFGVESQLRSLEDMLANADDPPPDPADPGASS